MAGTEQGQASDIDLPRLKVGITAAFEDLKNYRSERTLAIQQYHGPRYTGRKAVEAINMMELAVSIYSYQLVSHNPAAMVTTKQRELRPQAETLRLALDHIITVLDLQPAFSRCVVDAMFGIGIAKVGINSAKIPMRGFNDQGGQPFVESVSLDDFFYDTAAKQMDRAQFIGDRFRIPLKVATECGLYKPEDLVPDDGNMIGGGETKAADAAGGERKIDGNRYLKMITLMDVWLPYEGVVVTLNETMTKVLRIVEWQGPAKGPYHLLSFNPVPDNIMPLPPAMLWMDLHTLGNALFSKASRQALRQKTITGIASGGGDDATRVTEASDGDAVQIQNPKNAQEMNFGGANPITMGMIPFVNGLFNRFSGNIDTVGGLAPSSATVGQDKLLNENASMRLKKMQADTIKFVDGVIEDLAFWLWTDPYIDLPLVRRIERLGVEFPVRFSADTKQGEFIQYNFNIEPYSIVNRTPEQKCDELVQLIGNFVLPALPMMQAEGVTIDWSYLFSILSRYKNMPEIAQAIRFTEPIPMGPVGDGGSKFKTPTHSVYERRNTGGSTETANNSMLTQSFMAAGAAGQGQPAMAGMETQ